MRNSCWYSHDLENDAGLPIDDANALRKTLEMLSRMRKDERRAIQVCTIFKFGKEENLHKFGIGFGGDDKAL